jgi:hypothetical protein
MVAADADIDARMETRTALTHDDVPGDDSLATENLDA